jgi:hypothetical protein
MQTKALVASNHIAGVDIGPFRFISAYFRAYTENVTFFSDDKLGLIYSHVIMTLDLNARNPLWGSQVTDAKGRELGGIIPDCKRR